METNWEIRMLRAQVFTHKRLGDWRVCVCVCVRLLSGCRALCPDRGDGLLASRGSVPTLPGASRRLSLGRSFLDSRGTCCRGWGQESDKTRLRSPLWQRPLGPGMSIGVSTLLSAWSALPHVHGFTARPPVCHFVLLMKKRSGFGVVGWEMCVGDWALLLELHFLARSARWSAWLRPLHSVKPRQLDSANFCLHGL